MLNVCAVCYMLVMSMKLFKIKVDLCRDSSLNTNWAHTVGLFQRPSRYLPTSSCSVSGNQNKESVDLLTLAWIDLNWWGITHQREERWERVNGPGVELFQPGHLWVCTEVHSEGCIPICLSLLGHLIPSFTPCLSRGGNSSTIPLHYAFCPCSQAHLLKYSHFCQ